VTVTGARNLPGSARLRARCTKDQRTSSQEANRQARIQLRYKTLREEEYTQGDMAGLL